MSSSSQEGSRSSRSSHLGSARCSRSPSSSRRGRSSSRHSSRSHAPSRSSHVSGGSSRAPPSLSWHLVVVSPMHASRRTTPSANVNQAPPSPPPTFVTPVGPAPPAYTSRSGLVSRAPPGMLLPLFPSMTPPPRYLSPSPCRFSPFSRSRISFKIIEIYFRSISEEIFDKLSPNLVHKTRARQRPSLNLVTLTLFSRFFWYTEATGQEKRLVKF